MASRPSAVGSVRRITSRACSVHDSTTRSQPVAAASSTRPIAMSSATCGKEQLIIRIATETSSDIQQVPYSVGSSPPVNDPDSVPTFWYCPIGRTTQAAHPLALGDQGICPIQPVTAAIEYCQLTGSPGSEPGIPNEPSRSTSPA